MSRNPMTTEEFIRKTRGLKQLAKECQMKTKPTPAQTITLAQNINSTKYVLDMLTTKWKLSNSTSESIAIHSAMGLVKEHLVFLQAEHDMDSLRDNFERESV